MSFSRLIIAYSFCLTLLLALSSPASAVVNGKPAPPINVVTTSGQKVTLNNYKGYVLVMDFFATWCQPCREAVSHLVALNRKYGKQGLQILGMSVDDEGTEVVKEFIADRRINYPVTTVGEDIIDEYGVRSIPTLFIINKKGVVVERYMGFSEDTANAMEATIRKLLAE